MKQRSIGLYLHIPFCQHKCSYCDFYSIVTLDGMERFVQALCEEIRFRSQQFGSDAEVRSIFWGGGTPSLLSIAQTEQVSRVLTDSFYVAADVEWTIEANPGTVTLEKLYAYRMIGINRISFGVQSFDEGELNFLERIHSPHQAEHAVEMARRAGFDNINVDIMYALPGQSITTCLASLKRACALEPEHISAYSLVYEPATPLYHKLQRGEIVPLTDDVEAEFFLQTTSFLAEQGYQQYEVSNFARPGKECRHNLLYWHRGEYLGFGPSAHSHWDNTRWSNIRSVARYVELLARRQFPVAMTEHLTVEQQRSEAVFLALRADGIELATLESLYNCSTTTGPVAAVIADWQRQGLATCDGRRLCLNPSGYSLCDALTLELLNVLEHATTEAAVL
ncbi:MAG: radical SAM family heme chaperone HemW [Chlorobi bacterium]|nr:radical SAM family heme chaperone HemW [Chlorobiota bacterium]